MRKYFGTDGIRGSVGEGFITPDFVMKLGWAAGRVLAKTGSISAVNTLSGYLERADGKTVVFSIQANHHILGGRVMIAAIDSIVVALGR